MPDNEVILRLSTVALLAGFLIYMQWERAHKRAAIRRQFRRLVQREGEVVDSAVLRSRLEELRRNFATDARSHSRGFKPRQVLVAAARRKLGHLPFFKNHPAEREAEHHAE